MSSSPTVVVKKGGVLTTLVSGIFGLLIVCVLCAAGLGWYGLNLADRKVGEVLRAGGNLVGALPEWRNSLPVLADALDDRRAPEYREQLDVSVRLVAGRSFRDGAQAVIEVTNRSSAMVTFLTARIVVSDPDGVPRSERRTFIATPISLQDGEWRGPLLPGGRRCFALRVPEADSDMQASIEVTDLRIWNQERAAVAGSVDTPPATPVSRVPEP